MQNTGWDGQALSPAFDVAVTDDNRTPVFKVFVNWDRAADWEPNPVSGAGNNVGTLDDISKYVTSIQTKRSITTDVPEGTRLVTGQAVASATVTLIGDPEDNSVPATKIWSAFASDSPFFSKKRVGSPIKVFYGFEHGGYPVITRLSDDFNGTSLDTSVWTRVRSGVTVSGGSCVIPFGTTDLDDNTSLMESENYSMIGSSMTVQLGTLPIMNGGPIFDWGLRSAGSDSDKVAWYIYSGNINAAYRSRSGDDHFAWTAPFDVVNHKYLRISESAGTITWSTSADGAIWTAQFSMPSPVPVDVVNFYVWCHGSTEATVANIDAVNPGGSSGSTEPTSAAAEYVQQFTGYVRSLAPDAGQQTATLEALDLSDRLRNLVRYPLVLSGDAFGIPDARWGINSQWVIDYALRDNGYYCSPPPDDNTIVDVTMHGSLWPNVGKARRAWAYNYSTGEATLGRPHFFNNPGDTRGLMNIPLEVGHPESERQQIDALWDFTSPYRLGRGGSANTGLQLEWFDGDLWQRSTTDYTQMYEFKLELDASEHSSLMLLTYYRQWDGHVSAIFHNVNGGTTYVTSNGYLQDTDTFGCYVGVHVYFNSATNVTVSFNLNGRTESVTQDLTITWANTTFGTLEFINYYGGVRDVKLKTVNAPDWSSQTWNGQNSFLDPGLNELNIVPPTDEGTDAWKVIGDVAGAEFAAGWFDEEGNFQFRNRLTLTKPHFDIAIDAGTDMLGLQSSEAIDQVVNHATCTTTPYVVQPYTWVWATEHLRGLHSGETIDMWISLSDPVYGCQTGSTDPANPLTTGPFRWIPNGGIDVSDWNDPTFDSADAYHGYRASKDPKGDGYAVRNLLWTVEVFTNVIHIRCTNPNRFPVYLVSPYQDGDGNPLDSRSKGKPMLQVSGRFVTQATQVAGVSEGTTAQQAAASAIGTKVGSTVSTADSRNQTSIDDYGEQAVDLTASQWRQDAVSAQTMTDRIVAQLARPVPILPPVDIMGDPRLQLSDRLLADATDLTGMSQDGYAVGVSSTMAEAGFTQSITLNFVAPPGAWVLGDKSYKQHVGLSNLGNTTRLGHG